MAKTQLYITGNSSGIGKALVEFALKQTDFLTTGISRRGLNLQHENYKSLQVDLADFAKLNSIKFDLSDTNYAVLINNAGVIEPIQNVGKQSNESIFQLHAVNTIAPQVLCNAFINEIKNSKGLEKALILNISSGAAHKSISGWTTYSSSKAALDQYSKVLSHELIEYGFDFVKVYSIAPGVVDTEMQSVIRSKSKNEFSSIDYFKDLKASNALTSAEIVAEKIFKLILGDYMPQNVVCSVREFN